MCTQSRAKVAHARTHAHPIRPGSSHVGWACAHSMPPSSTSTKRKSDAIRGMLARTSDSLPSTSNERRSAGDVADSPASVISTGSGAQRTRCVPLPMLAAGPESAALTLTYPGMGHTAACSMAARRPLRFSRSKLFGFASMRSPVPACGIDARHTHTDTDTHTVTHTRARAHTRAHTHVHVSSEMHTCEKRRPHIREQQQSTHS